jgi:excisionase family DNA binding protein
LIDQQKPRRERRHPYPDDLDVTTQDLIRRRKLWPVPEAASLLGVSKPTLYRWARDGIITFSYIDGRTLVADAELDRFVAWAQVTSKRPVEGTKP